MKIKTLQERRFDELRYWYNPSTKEAIKLNTDHVSWIITHPEKFGISSQEMKNMEEPDIDEDGELIPPDDAIMTNAFSNGWVRINVNGWGIPIINADNLLTARDAVRWLGYEIEIPSKNIQVEIYKDHELKLSKTVDLYKFAKYGTLTENINEDVGGAKAMKSSKFWLNTKSQEIVWLVESNKEPHNIHHTEFVKDHPKLFGLTTDEVKNNSSSEKPYKSYYDRNLLWYLLQRGWTRVISFPDNIKNGIRGQYVGIEAFDLIDVKKSLKILMATFGLHIHRVHIEQRTSTGFDAKNIRLDTDEEVDYFMKYGRVPRKINEEISATKQLQSTSFWFNTATNQIIWAIGRHHSEVIKQNPELVGLTKKDIKKIQDDPDSYYDPNIIWYLLQRNWVRCSIGKFDDGDVSLNFETASLLDAKKTSNYLIKTFGLRVHDIYIDIRTSNNDKQNNSVQLNGSEKVEYFLKYGRKKRVTEALQYTKLWYHVPTKQIINVPSNTNHTTFVQLKPELFGYTKDNIAGVASRSSQIMDDGIFADMLNKHWVRVSITNGTQVSLDALNIKDAQKTLQGLTEIFPEFLVIKTIHIADNTVEIDDEYVLTNDRAIELFTRHGRIPHQRQMAAESIDFNRNTKFWFNSNTEEIYFFDSYSDHTPQVLNNPEHFGLTKQWVLNDYKGGEFFDLKLIRMLQEKGWVRGGFSYNRYNQIYLDGESVPVIQKTIKWILKNYPQVAKACVEIKGKSFFILDSEKEIKFFIKYGKIPRAMAAESIKESIDPKTDIVMRIKTSFKKISGIQNVDAHFGKARRITMPSIATVDSNGNASSIKPLREVFHASQQVVDFIHKSIAKIEDAGWMLTTAKQQGDMFVVTLDSKPTSQQLGLLFYPTDKIDEVLKNGISNEEILLGRNPAAAKLIALRNITKGIWAPGTISIAVVNAANTNLAYYPHKDYNNCVYTNGVINQANLKKYKENLDL